ncbi:kinase-like domain-containing protein [Achaetomium macrosporum]|uniref:Kinase-like domain-containing protein n=1 Tax=Achaetomium macrosporum TaxID=79813 RepID=A0AAN7C5S0_9PEZI|nr:kinase-like domain-containing protein [Achaetomium macrosporum]
MARNPYSYFSDPYSGFIYHESLYGYRPGGFHPVSLGDTFRDGRYEIRRKLGFGQYSTVWLARDHQAQRWVAIKIKAAEDSLEVPDADPEVRVVLDLERHYASLPQEKPRYFARLLEVFRCHKLTLRPDTILRASQQLLEAVASLHHMGIAHGDISYSNVAFTCKQAMESEEDLFHVLGTLETIESSQYGHDFPPNLPRYMYDSAGWASWFEEVDEEICLLDWASYFPLHQRPGDFWQPRSLRSPETFFAESFDHRHDLWWAGCVIYALSYPKFCRYGGSDELLVLEWEKQLGPLPETLQARWEDMLKDTLPGRRALRKPYHEAPITDSFELRRQ